jgi:8-oxo-dGTP pyrophosphatase MutT (NUDIX family)
MTDSKLDFKVDFKVDFKLGIAAPDANTMRVTVADLAPMDVPRPFTDADLARVLGLLSGTLEASRGEINRVCRQFGEQLFNGVFTGTVATAYQNALTHGEVRIRLNLDEAGDLADVPWELMRDPRTDYLALSRTVAIVRTPNTPILRPIIEISYPLRVLVVIANPGDQTPIDADEEWQALKQSTAALRARGLLHLERVADGRPATLQRKLREGVPYQIFHFMGHAAYDERTEIGMLAFEDSRSGNTLPVSGEALARELAEEHGIRLVVLNTGVRVERQDVVGNIATSIIARGLPAVVSMQFPISEETSRTFATEFYQSIAEGYPVEAGVASARRALFSTNMEWVTPVLHLNASMRDGILFPRRRSVDGAVTTGGLRDVLRSPLAILSAFAVIALVVGASIVVNLLRNPADPSVTETPPSIPGGITDLALTRVVFTPNDPAPHEPVTISMLVQNQSEVNSGPFQWSWTIFGFSGTSQTLHIGDVRNLAPGGITLSLKATSTFGWWGIYNTNVLVNLPFGGDVLEQNRINNARAVSIATSDDPFLIDFTILPSGEDVLAERILQGNEYEPWHITINPRPAAGCEGAVVRLAVENNINQLQTAVPGSASCTDVPIGFTFSPPENGAQVATMSVNFFPALAGTYTLEVRGAADEPIAIETVEIPAENASLVVPQLISLQIPEGSTLDGATLVFTPPQGSITAIQSLILERLLDPLP